MLSCLIAYLKHFKRGGCDTMDKLEIRVVIKYFCTKGMPPREMHEEFMEPLGRSLLIVQ